MELDTRQVRAVREYLRRNRIDSRMVRSDLTDHICCMVEQAMDGGASFDEALQAAASCLSGAQMHEIETQTLKLLDMEATCSRRKAFWAVLPYSILCFSFGIQSHMLREFSAPRWTAETYNVLFEVFPLLYIFICAVIAWRKGFPRWSFPTIGMAVWLFVMMGREAITGASGGALWVAFGILTGVALIAAIIARPSFRPLAEAWNKLKDDPWLVLFAFYYIICIFIIDLTDKRNGIWASIAFSALTTAGFTAGFVTFLTSPRKTRRVGAIIAAPAVIAALYMAFTRWL